MRWPWQRKTTESEVPAPTAARPHAEWRQVGGLRPTADPFAPTLLAPGLPVIASTRSLLHRERTSPDVSPVPPGRVSGLSSVLPTPSLDVAPPSEPAPARPVVPARTHRTVTLTRAVADYVGEARVPAVPYRAPAWLRASSNAPLVVTPLDAFVTKPADDTPALPEIALLDSWATPPSVVPSTPDAEPVQEDEPVRPPVPIRRHRRRPGLGLPLPPGERPPSEQPPSPKPSPSPSPSPAPSRTPKVVESEPRPPTLVRPETPEPPPPPQQTRQPKPEAPPVPTPVPTPEPHPEPVVAVAPVGTSEPVAEGAAGPRLVHPRVVPGRFSARIPTDLLETFERSYGVEVADVTVDRSPAAAAEARAIGAKAFAHADRIVLPEETGPVESVETRALLGHELAHVVQQRTIGSLPAESDADGQRLEAAARSVEEWVRAGAAGPPPPVIPPTPPRPGAPPDTIERPAPAPVRRRASADPPSSAGAPQRAVTGLATAPASSAPVVTTTTAPSTTGNNTVGTTTSPSLLHPRTTDTHAPENPRNAHEFGTLMRDSLAGMGADLFGLGGLLGGHDTPTPPTPQTPRSTTTTTSPSSTPGSVPSLPGTTGTAPTATFDRNRRREQLTHDTLERLNVVREQQGQAPLTELPATEAMAIESQLDAEERNGGGPSAADAAPVINNWHDFGNQFRLAGGEVLGSLFGINPVEMADQERQRKEAEARALQQQQGASGTHTTSTVGAAAAAGAAGAAVGHPDRPGAPEATGAELARLYDRIHTRLVRELLVGRERSGSLMDFR